MMTIVAIECNVAGASARRRAQEGRNRPVGAYERRRLLHGSAGAMK
jgi:hypothetical protein